MVPIQTIPPVPLVQSPGPNRSRGYGRSDGPDHRRMSVVHPVSARRGGAVRRTRLDTQAGDLTVEVGPYLVAHAAEVVAGKLVWGPRHGDVGLTVSRFIGAGRRFFRPSYVGFVTDLKEELLLAVHRGARRASISVVRAASLGRAGDRGVTGQWFR